MADHHDTEVEPGTDETPAVDPEVLARREAALARVLKFGDPVLKSKASPVSRFDETLEDEIARMLAIMHDGMGVGLAATQLGILRRLLVFQAGHDAEPTALINPEIAWTSEEVAVAEEGCLSIPKVTVDVERPLYVKIEGLDQQGEETTIEASGLEARVLQHEVDHLDGVLMLDRTTREQRKGAMRALREGVGYSPPLDEAEDAKPEDAAATPA
jgi:peptide deformylase